MKNDYSAIFQILIPTPLGKGEAKKREVILQTIELGGQEGLEACTFDRIAKIVGSTRPLLNHYFKSRENLFSLAAEVVRLKIQTYVLEKIKKNTSSDHLIITYIAANLSWYDEDPIALKYYVQFLSYASCHKKLAEKNNNFVEMGLSRIEEILKAGIKNNELKLPQNINLKICSRNIQLQITGALISFATENKKTTKNEIKGVIESCKLLLSL